MKTLLASDKHLKEEQNKTESTIEVLKEAQIKADGCLQKFESNKRKLKTKIASRQASVDKLKKTVNTGLEIWKMLGLSVEELGKDGSNAEGGDQHFNGNLAITFTKVDQQNPSAAYVVKVNVTNNKVKSKFISGSLNSALSNTNHFSSSLRNGTKKLFECR